MNTTRNELNAANLEAGQLALELLDIMETEGLRSDDPELDGHWDALARRTEEAAYLRSQLPATDWRQVWPEGAE
jgi:hypothetical protein